jgi:hypothetical protein
MVLLLRNPKQSVLTFFCGTAYELSSATFNHSAARITPRQQTEADEAPFPPVWAQQVLGFP